MLLVEEKVDVFEVAEKTFHPYRPDLSQNERVLNLLKDALTLLNSGQNWIRGKLSHYCEGEVSYCTLGAIQYSSYNNEILADMAKVAFRKANGISNIIPWNDLLARNWYDIERGFLKAIAYQQAICDAERELVS